MNLTQLQAYAEQLDTWLWTHSRETNPQGYADRERELELTIERLEMMRG